MIQTPKMIGTIGHIDSGKHSLTAAIVQAILQAGIEVVPLSDTTPSPTLNQLEQPQLDVNVSQQLNIQTGWLEPDQLDFGKGGQFNSKPTPSNKCYSNRHKKSRY
jgi:hypothetical protein